MGFRTRDKVVAGSLAPNFTLPSQSGKMVSLRDFLGKKPVILFFYPKDDTPGCTKKACAFRERRLMVTYSAAGNIGDIGRLEE